MLRQKKAPHERTRTGQQRARAGGQEIARQRQCRIVPSLNANGRRVATAAGLATHKKGGPDSRPVACLGAGDQACEPLVSVVVVVMIGVIGVGAMVASVIGHGISDYPSHNRADGAADNSPGDRAPD